MKEREKGMGRESRPLHFTFLATLLAVCLDVVWFTGRRELD